MIPHADAALRAAIVRGARVTGVVGVARPNRRLGDGLAFSQLRAYVEGDDPRRIDHAATARSGTLQTRVFVEESALLLSAIVDDSPSMRVGRRRALLDAAHDALDAWFAAAANDDRVARIVDDRIVRGRRVAVAAVAMQPFALDSALRVALYGLARGASLLAITDGFDAVDDGVLLRAGRRFDATALIAEDPWRDGLTLDGIVSVGDAETGAVRRIAVGARARERYVAATRERTRHLYARYRGAGWRVGALREDDGRASLLETFGVRA